MESSGLQAAAQGTGQRDQSRRFRAGWRNHSRDFQQIEFDAGKEMDPGTLELAPLLCLLQVLWGDTARPSIAPATCPQHQSPGLLYASGMLPLFQYHQERLGELGLTGRHTPPAAYVFHPPGQPDCRTNAPAPPVPALHSSRNPSTSLA